MQQVDYKNDLEDQKLIDDDVIQEQKKLQGSPNYTAPQKIKNISKSVVHQQYQVQSKQQGPPNALIAPQKNKKKQKNSVLKQKRIAKIIKQMQNKKDIDRIEIKKMKKAMNQKYLGFSTKNTLEICDFIRESNKQMRFKFRKHIRKYGKIKGNGILYGFTSKKKIMTFFRLISKYSYRKLYKSAMSKGLISINTNSTRIFLTMKQMDNLIILQKFKITLRALFRSGKIQALQYLVRIYQNHYRENSAGFQQYIEQLNIQKKLILNVILQGKQYNADVVKVDLFENVALYFISTSKLKKLRKILHQEANWPLPGFRFPNQQHQILPENPQPVILNENALPQSDYFHLYEDIIITYNPEDQPEPLL